MTRRLIALVGILILLTILMALVWAVYRHRTQDPGFEDGGTSLASITAAATKPKTGGRS